MPDHNIELLPTDTRDLALGRYMDRFGQLELMISQTTRQILDISPHAARAISSAIMTRQAIDLLGAAAKLHLNAVGIQKIIKLCERLLRRNQRRNSIVHGSWTLAAVISDGGISTEWVRVYNAIDPDKADAKYYDPNVLGFYTFTIPELDKATHHVEEMVLALSEIYAELPALRVVP